jgi:hypothetical protein
MMLVQIQEQKYKHKVKISEILKNANERQCFGYLSENSEITDLGEDHYQLTSSTTTVFKLCDNGLLMSKAGIGDESSTLSIYDYVADEADVLGSYKFRN